MSTPILELEDAISTAVMAYFEIPQKSRTKLPGLTKPYQLLLKELISDDAPVPVPVDWALENIFTDFTIDEFCTLYHLEYEITTYWYKGHQIDRAFYVFTFKTE